MARRWFAILLAALLAAPLLGTVPRAFDGEAHAAPPKKKATKPTKKKKKKKSPKPPPEEPPPRVRPRGEVKVLGAARAAGWVAPKTLEWEDQADGRPPLLVIESGGKDQQRALLIGSAGSGKAARPTVAEVPIAGLDADTLVVASVGPFLQTGFGEVRITVARNDREETTHAIVRAGATSADIVCVFAGSAQGTKAAGRARWIRTSQVRGTNVPTFDVEIEEWGRERDGQHELTIVRYEVPVADVCRAIEPPRATARGTLTIDTVKVVKGERDEAPVHKIVTARAQAGLSRCYDEALRDSPALAGKLVVRIRISAPGLVTAADVTTDRTGQSGGWACVKGVLASLYFPIIQLPEDDEEEDASAKKKKKEPDPTAEVEIALTLTPPPAALDEEEAP